MDDERTDCPMDMRALIHYIHGMKYVGKPQEGLAPEDFKKYIQKYKNECSKSAINPETVKNMYLEGESVDEISAELHRSIPYIHLVLRRQGIYRYKKSV